MRLELGSRLVEQRTDSGFAQGPSSMAWKKFREDYSARRIRGRGFNLAVRVRKCFQNIVKELLEQLNGCLLPSWKGRNDPDGRAMILNMFVHRAHHRPRCEVYP